MINKRKNVLFFTLLAATLMVTSLLTACQREVNEATAVSPPVRYPAITWQQVASPAEAGWSPDKLTAAQTYADRIGSAAVMVIDNGAVVAAWGDVERRFMLHSIRKSLFNALIGIYQDAISLEKTLADLGIDDREGLTSTEKEATIYDLLTAQSGVYHPATYETRLWQERRPVRGSHAPGTFWYYNNWDFNALLTIFEQETGARIFDEFEQRIAEPLQMQDYRPRDGYYHWETAVSDHPAYPFRMSARDLARFGWLYLNEGRWQGWQLVPAKWIAASTQTHAETKRDADFGYLWWVFDEAASGRKGYVARGGDTQMLVVLPEENLVFVHLANTYAGETVSQDEVWALLEMVLDANNGVPSSDPTLVPLPSSPPAEVVTLASDQLADYAHTYIYPDGRQIEVQLIDETLVMDFGYGQFDLLPLSNNEFWVADTRERVAFQRAADGGLQMVYEALTGNPFQTTGPAIAATAS